MTPYYLSREISPALSASSSPWPREREVESAARPSGDSGGRTDTARVLLAADLFGGTGSL